MSLPKIQHPIFNTLLPSTGKEIEYRPMTNREQKSLLMAKESDNNNDSLEAVARVVGDCFSLDFKEISIMDLEFLFLCLRAKSIGNKLEIKFPDPEDGESYDATIDLDNIEITKPEGWKDNTININGEIIITMKDPTVSSMLKATDKIDEWDVMIASIKSITSGEDVTLSSEVTREELREWLLGLPISSMQQMKEFFDNRPKVNLVATYYKNGVETKSKLNGFNNFFT